MNIHRELAAKPHSRADGLALHDIHHALPNTAAKTTSRQTYSTTRGSKNEYFCEVNAATVPIANRRHTKAVKTYIQARYFLNAAIQRFFLGKFQTTQQEAQEKWPFRQQ